MKQFKVNDLTIEVAIINLGLLRHCICNIKNNVGTYKGVATLDYLSPNEVRLLRNEPQFIGVWNVKAGDLSGAGTNDYDMCLGRDELHLIIQWRD